MRRGEEFWSTDGEVTGLAERWQEMLSMTHLPWSVTISPQECGAAVFEASVRRWWIDDLALVDCRCHPCSGTRNRREIASTDGEFVVVLIDRAGRETVVQDGFEVRLRPGDAVVWDSAKPAQFRVPGPLAKRSLLIPRGALDEVTGRGWVSGGVVLDGSSPATMLLMSYLETLSRALSELESAAVTGARNATLELFVGALRSESGIASASVAHPALRAAMDRYIERHLVTTVVSPAMLAKAHGVSVRTVNRVYNATGQTVGEVVRARRLARAREDLTGSDRTVGSIAHRWGFADSSHFSRLFKAHYGTSPRAYRASCRGQHDDGVSVHGPVAPVHRTSHQVV